MNPAQRRSCKLAVALSLGLGVVLSGVAVTADWLGIGGQPGFGWKQGVLLVLGLVLFRSGWWLLRALRNAQGEKELSQLILRLQEVLQWLRAVWAKFCGEPDLGPPVPHAWPRIRDVLLASFLALLLVAVDVYFSSQNGLLAYPPAQDGVTYMLHAKVSFYRLQHRQDASAPVFLTENERAPLWLGLMLANFFVLGEGEWQAYIVRFWPIFLLLLLMLWVLRRRASQRWAWVVTLATCLLPALCVGLHASRRVYLDGTFYSGPNSTLWYLADLRPDLLFAVLLVWMVATLVEHVRRLDRTTWLVSGASAALAVLVKPSATPMLLLAYGAAILYGFWVNRDRLLLTLWRSSWSLVPLGLLLVPWILAGGANWLPAYLYDLFTSQKALYSEAQASLISEATYYWKLFGLHMGYVEGWGVLGVGLLFFLVGIGQKRNYRQNDLIAYLVIAAALYGMVSATPAKNYFLGLPYYLLLWLFSWGAVAPFLVQLGQHQRRLAAALVLVVGIYAGWAVAAGFYALHRWPESRRGEGRFNSEVSRRIAADLRGVVTNQDTFMWYPAYGNPATLEYYTVDATGAYPTAYTLNPVTSPSPDQFVWIMGRSCAAILVFREDIEEVAVHLTVLQAYRPHLRATASWVRRPDSGFRLVRTYRLAEQTGGFHIELYVKSSPQGQP